MIYQLFKFEGPNEHWYNKYTETNIQYIYVNKKITKNNCG